MRPTAEPSGISVNKGSVPNVATVPSRPCQDANSDEKCSPHSANNSLMFSVHKTFSVPSVESTSLKIDYDDLDLLLASTPRKATVSIPKLSNAVESSVLMGTTDVSLGLRNSTLVTPVKATNCFSNSSDEFAVISAEVAELAHSFVVPQTEMSEWVNNPSLVSSNGVRSSDTLLDVNQNFLSRSNVPVPKPIIPITMAQSLMAQNVPPPSLICPILSFPSIDQVLGQHLPQSYPQTHHHSMKFLTPPASLLQVQKIPAPPASAIQVEKIQTPPASTIDVQKIQSPAFICCQLNNAEMLSKQSEDKRILTEQKTLIEDQWQSVNTSNNANANANLSLSLDDKAHNESIDKLFRNYNLQHTLTQSAISSPTTSTSPLHPLAKVFMPKAYLDEGMVSSDMLKFNVMYISTTVFFIRKGTNCTCNNSWLLATLFNVL